MIYSALKDFLKFHFSDDSGYYSKIHIGIHRHAQKNKGIWKLFYFDNRNMDFIYGKTDTFYQHNDYYITKNGFRSANERSVDTIFQGLNIVVDIDCHTKDRQTAEKEIESFLYFFREDLCTEPDFPVPNTIVRTGRGVQLWWRIISMAAQLKEQYKAVCGLMVDRINALIDEIPSLFNLAVDRRATNNLAGYVRLPGTYNSKAGCYGEFEILHTEYLDAVGFLHNKYPIINKKEKK